MLPFTHSHAVVCRYSPINQIHRRAASLARRDHARAAGLPAKPAGRGSTLWPHRHQPDWKHRLTGVGGHTSRYKSAMTRAAYPAATI